MQHQDSSGTSTDVCVVLGLYMYTLGPLGSSQPALELSVLCGRRPSSKDATLSYKPTSLGDVAIRDVDESQ